MDELTKLIKTEIKKQFRSVRQFSMYIGVPQSTIVTALQKGIGGTSFETIMQICKVLDIKPVAGESLLFLDGDKRELLERFTTERKPSAPSPPLSFCASRTLTRLMRLAKSRSKNNPVLTQNEGELPSFFILHSAPL